MIFSNHSLVVFIVLLVLLWYFILVFFLSQGWTSFQHQSLLALYTHTPLATRRRLLVTKFMQRVKKLKVKWDLVCSSESYTDQPQQLSCLVFVRGDVCGLKLVCLPCRPCTRRLVLITPLAITDTRLNIQLSALNSQSVHGRLHWPEVMNMPSYWTCNWTRLIS